MSDDKHFECTLSLDARMKDCRGCEGCGWERAEAARRRAYIKEHGLTLCADGLWRLVMKKEENEMATHYKECPLCGAHLDNGERCDCTENRNGDNSPKENKSFEGANSNDGN